MKPQDPPRDNIAIQPVHFDCVKSEIVINN